MSASDALSAIVLAAGQGTRMRSTTPKVLHTIAGRPLAAWAIEAVRPAAVAPVDCCVSRLLSSVRTVASIAAFTLLPIATKIRATIPEI